MEGENQKNIKKEIEELKEETRKVKELKKEIESFLSRLKETETRLRERDKIQLSYLLGRKISGTTHATPGTQTTHPHYLGRTPAMVFITPKGNGVVYSSASPTDTNIYVKGSASPVDFDAFCIL